MSSLLFPVRSSILSEWWRLRPRFGGPTNQKG